VLRGDVVLKARERAKYTRWQKIDTVRDEVGEEGGSRWHGVAGEMRGGGVTSTSSTPANAENVRAENSENMSFAIAQHEQWLGNIRREDARDERQVEVYGEESERCAVRAANNAVWRSGKAACTRAGMHE